MGRFVIAVYRVKKGMEEDLLAVLRDHLTVLRREGLATEEPAHVLRGQDGVYLEMFEWKSPEAAAAADENEAVNALWPRFERVCEYRRLAHLPESHQLFAEFESVDLEAAAGQEGLRQAGGHACSPVVKSPKQPAG